MKNFYDNYSYLREPKKSEGFFQKISENPLVQKNLEKKKI